LNVNDPIVLDGVSKAFRVFTERNQSLKQAVLRRNRAKYEEFWALDDVSFSIPEGSTFGIIGSNGAGKSTALKLLAQILVPDKGTVKVEGRVSALLELGAGFHPDLTGRENVYLNGAILGLSRRTLRERMDAIVSFAGLESFIDQPVKTYSSGMYARLGFAVAVHVEPEILLLDEVLAVGDELFQRKCAEKVAELRSGGRTVVLVSHSMGSIQAMCDHAAWIDQGRCRFVGKTNEVVDEYLGAVHPSVVVDESGRTRTGNGDARVRCSFGTRASHVRVAEPFSLVFDIDADRDVPSAHFAFSIWRPDGYLMTGRTTRSSGTTVSLRRGPNRVKYSSTSMSLLQGSYKVDIELIDGVSELMIDHCDDVFRFDIGPAVDHEHRWGLVDLPGTWVFNA
jgi:ABC-type polysaccharide/polyol phosphate transport system ATPase subunit